MKDPYKKLWLLVLLAIALTLSLAANIGPYDWNITSVFHMDERLHAIHPMPENFVVLTVPSYDGAQYYQIARNMPKIFSRTQWNTLRDTPPVSYAYQRFLLPLAAYGLSLGHEAALPWTFVLINITALLLTAFAVLQFRKEHPIYAFALALSPTAMVAMHFTLAEPLTLLLITLSLLRFEKQKRIDALTVLLLSVVVLAREVNILFILFLFGYSLLKTQKLDCLKLLIPVLAFLSLHSMIYMIFGDIPFFMSTAAHQWPGAAAYDVLTGHRGYDRYTLSACALLLGFVLPALFWTGREILQSKTVNLFPFGAFAFLCLMLIMPDYIWGSITSIGRVITPVYPLTILALASRDSLTSRILASLILLLGIGTAIGLAMQVHPYFVV